MVVGVFRGSPAEKAGLHAGDIVLTIDGTTTEGRDPRRDRRPRPRRARHDRQAHRHATAPTRPSGPSASSAPTSTSSPVSWAMVPGDEDGRSLRLEQFSTGAADEAPQGLRGDHQGRRRPARSLDLRGNPGGFVNEAVAVARASSCRVGNVYIERNAKGERRRHSGQAGRPRDDDPARRPRRTRAPRARPRSSAARSRTPGRAHARRPEDVRDGTVLGEFPLADGSRAPDRDGQWLTPKGRVIWHNGIVPDQTVARPADTNPSPRRPPHDDGGTGEEIADPQLVKRSSSPQRRADGPIDDRPTPTRLSDQRPRRRRLRCRRPTRAVAAARRRRRLAGGVSRTRRRIHRRPARSDQQQALDEQRDLDPARRGGYVALKSVEGDDHAERRSART